MNTGDRKLQLDASWQRGQEGMSSVGMGTEWGRSQAAELSAELWVVPQCNAHALRVWPVAPDKQYSGS